MNFDEEFFGKLVQQKQPQNIPKIPKPVKKKVTLTTKNSFHEQSQSISTFYQNQPIRWGKYQNNDQENSWKIRSRTDTKDSLMANSTTSVRTKNNKKVQVTFKTTLIDQEFSCRLCETKSPNKNCETCDGYGKVDGSSNLLKFFEYIMQYKLNLKQSYVSQDKSKNLRKYEKRTKMSTISNRNSVKKSCRLSDIQEMQKQQMKVHTGYECDQCSQAPIKGIRYHCTNLQCQDDYDMCQQCYRRISHRHPDDIVPIQKCKNRQKYASLVTNLLKSSDLGSKSKPSNIYKSTIN